MSRNGSGTYSLPQPPFVPGTTIESTPVNSNFSDIAQALTGSVAADGQTPMTGTLPMNTNAISGVTTITGVTGTFSGMVTGANIGRGCLVSKALNQTIATSTNTLLTWGVEAYDDAAIFDIGQPTRLTVPAGFTRVQISFALLWDGAFNWSLTPLKNGAAYIGAPNGVVARATLDTLNAGSGTSAVLAVTPGDYFEIQVQQISGFNHDIVATGPTWFCMELLR